MSDMFGFQSEILYSLCANAFSNSSVNIWDMSFKCLHSESTLSKISQLVFFSFLIFSEIHVLYCIFSEIHSSILHVSVLDVEFSNKMIDGCADHMKATTITQLPLLFLHSQVIKSKDSSAKCQKAAGGNHRENLVSLLCSVIIHRSSWKSIFILRI